MWICSRALCSPSRRHWTTATLDRRTWTKLSLSEGRREFRGYDRLSAHSSGPYFFGFCFFYYHFSSKAPNHGINPELAVVVSHEIFRIFHKTNSFFLLFQLAKIFINVFIFDYTHLINKIPLFSHFSTIILIFPSKIGVAVQAGVVSNGWPLQVAAMELPFTKQKRHIYRREEQQEETSIEDDS